MLPQEIVTAFETEFYVRFGKQARIERQYSLGGGCINEAVRITSGKEDYFIKYNLASRYPDMFMSEAQGLGLIENTKTIKTPGVLFFGNTGIYTYLVLEYVEQEPSSGMFWEIFGRQLADLHRNTAGFFGLDTNNYIGSLQQSNRCHDEWMDFFITERLEPQLKLALNSGRLGSSTKNRFSSLFNKLGELIPKEIPALVHGDLWNGNYLVTAQNKPCLIDPSVYFGHREMDIAMTRLFGGFPAEFYHSYSASFPLEPGWQSRADIHNLYPLLVHVNLFGGGYAGQVERIVERYS